MSVAARQGFLPVDVAPEDEGAGDDGGDGDQGKEGQLGADGEHHDAHAEEHDELEEKAAGDLVDEAVEGLGVVGNAAEQVDINSDRMRWFAGFRQNGGGDLRYLPIRTGFTDSG